MRITNARKNNGPTKRKREELHNPTIVHASWAESTVKPRLWDILLALIKSVWSLLWRGLPDGQIRSTVVLDGSVSCILSCVTWHSTDETCHSSCFCLAESSGPSCL